MSGPDPSWPAPIALPSSRPPSGPPGAMADPAGLRGDGLRRDSGIVALGVALLVGAVVISATRARSRGDLDATVYLVGVGAVIALLGLGLAARALVPKRHVVRELVSWPLAFGAVGAGLVLATGLDDGTSTTYLSGALVLLIAAGAYVLAPSAPPVVAGVLGLLAVYGQGFTDAADFDVAEANGFKTYSVAVLLFVVLVTAIAWFLPPARTTVTVVVGAGSVLAYVALMAAIGFARLFGFFVAEFDDVGPVGPPPSYDGDVYLTLVLAALLVAGWLVLGYLTDQPGFRVLVVAMVATVFPAGVLVLTVEHPTVWGFVAGLLGALVLATVGGRAMTAARRTPRSS